LGEVLHELVLTLLHFLWRQVFLVRRNRPHIPGGVEERAAAIAPELIGHLAHLAVRLGAGGEGAVEQRITILDVHPQRRGRSPERLRSLAATHHVVHHDVRIADLQVGVQDFPVGPDGARYFLSAERFFVPVDGLCGVIERQLRRDGVEPFRDGVLCFCHAASCIGNERRFAFSVSMATHAS
jgi:hypothetical protein